MSGSTILIMAGGTGGHIMPGLAVAEVLRRLGWDVLWLGNPQRMEGQLVPARGFTLLPLHFAGVRGRGLRALLKLPFTLSRACLQVRRHLRSHHPDVALSMGGYVAFPGGLMARLSGIPLVVHEQNAVAGTANRLLARLAGRVLAGFPGALPHAEVVGNPVHAAFGALAAPRERYAGRRGPLQLLVLGGSQGAAFLNALIPEALSLLEPAVRPQVCHQTGARHADAVRQAYTRLGVEAHVTPFIEQMADAMSAADLVICRAGAMTVAEVAAAGVAALFVPFPYAIDDHQTANARFLSGCGGGWLLAQAQLDAGQLAQWLRARERRELAAVAECAHVHAAGDAARKIAEACIAAGREAS